MIRLVRSRAPQPKTLAQQQADFTAEGAPPPGTVAGSNPVGAGPADKLATCPPDGARGAIKRTPAGAAR